MTLIDKAWTPNEIGDLKSDVEKLRIRVKADMPTEEINRLHIEVLMFASSLTWPIAQARFYEAKMLKEFRHAQTTAFLLAEGSDRKRDAEAKRNAEARVAESKFQEAEVSRKLLEDVKSDLEKIHYALKATLTDKVEERKYNY